MAKAKVTPIESKTENVQEEPKTKLECQKVTVHYNPSSPKQPDIFIAIVHVDMGDATKEVGDGVVDYNTGWITLWDVTGKKIMLSAGIISRLEFEITGDIEEDRVPMKWL